ncbi:hypothetical protein GALMADRAFT_255555, partial [Galerina marginata CBS 339.88]
MTDTRKKLNIALDHARRAVELDTQGDDMNGAIAAYSQSTSLLSRVIEDMRRETQQSGDGARKPDDLAKLVKIHDSYRDRMMILSSVTGIPLPQGESRPSRL